LWHYDRGINFNFAVQHVPTGLTFQHVTERDGGTDDMALRAAYIDTSFEKFPSGKEIRRIGWAARATVMDACLRVGSHRRAIFIRYDPPYDDVLDHPVTQTAPALSRGSCMTLDRRDFLTGLATFAGGVVLPAFPASAAVAEARRFYFRNGLIITKLTPYDGLRSSSPSDLAGASDI
jgi:hypothetical protein